MRVWYLWEVILGDDSIGESIRQWRINIGMSIADASRQAGIAASAWGRIENGVTADPSMKTLCKMFTALGAQIEVKIAPGKRQWQQEPLPQAAESARKASRERLHADG